MGVEQEKSAVYGHMFSTVVPGDVTGEAVVHELADMDLVTKLHYLRAVYYFSQSEVVDGLAITDLKRPMFPWLNVLYPLAGRIRRAEAGRPFIKCNDCGLRIVEASCSKTLEEWLDAEDDPRWGSLVPEKILGPELPFSPLVYIQFTRFKCGGMAIGYSWSHVLGDAASATNCINLWGDFLNGNDPPTKPFQLSNMQNTAQDYAPQKAPASVKQVEIANDCWLFPNACKMATHSFKVTETELDKVQKGQKLQFELIAALFWLCLSRIQSGKELKLATICRHGTQAKCSDMLSNNIRTSTVKLDSSAASVGLFRLANLIVEQDMDELESVEQLVDRNSGKPDFLLYGANLTFVDMRGINLFGLELKGQKPVKVDLSIDGVGDEGAVLVLPCPQRSDVTVMVILPEDQIPKLRRVLDSEFGIA
ncbi:protein ECERIFERUM 26-like [Zingiber officinale]|uniref:Protein ECERIFERUM 26-like n=1 Tax=Zingiber officinale TaxID=94328 RepID=A0A8J5FKX3_ZINOF|nr:protein ECERIFERUM 26-like [Zingiber officinale]KAG6491518.1 hypothetical protein ZIOFF_046450 [Zingiber officinale]